MHQVILIRKEEPSFQEKGKQSWETASNDAKYTWVKQGKKLVTHSITFYGANISLDKKIYRNSR